MAPPTSNGNGNRAVFDRRSLIDVSLAIALVVSAFHVGQKMEEIEGSLRSLDDTLTRTTQNALTRQEFELWKARLRAINPETEVPD